jgi:hypothetical protein
MTDSEYSRALILGAIIGASVVILGLYMVKPEPQQPVAPKSNFEVVDTYKNCEVVRWTNGQLANYQFFLHCPL